VTEKVYSKAVAAIHVPPPGGFIAIPGHGAFLGSQKVAFVARTVIDWRDVWLAAERASKNVPAGPRAGFALAFEAYEKQVLAIFGNALKSGELIKQITSSKDVDGRFVADWARRFLDLARATDEVFASPTEIEDRIGFSFGAIGKAAASALEGLGIHPGLALAGAGLVLVLVLTRKGAT
jgi:hypothetical protein